MRSRFLFTAGMVGVLSGVASGATDGSDVDYGREYNPYVTLRGGWLFGGKTKYSDHLYEPPTTNIYGDRKKSFKSAWSGSSEFGVSLCDDRVLLGLELGYFSGKVKWEFDATELARYSACPIINFNNGTYCIADGKYRNLFATANVTLKKDVGERTFLYCGVGAGVARSDFGRVDWKWDDAGAKFTDKIDFKAKWRVLTQVFAGAGVYFNGNWSLTLGYRLRYLPGDCKGSKKFNTVGNTWSWTLKQNLLHAAEIGLTYQF